MINDAKARAAKPREKRYQLIDGDGLHLEIMPSGSKFWRLRFMRDGKRKWQTIGEYPAISIAEARACAAEMRQRIKSGELLDEEVLRKRKKENRAFAEVAMEWAQYHDSRISSESGKKKIRCRMNKHIMPALGDKSIMAIEPQDVLAILQKLAGEKKFDMMTRIRSIISQIFRFAAANGLNVSDPTSVLRGAFIVPKPSHFASLKTSHEVGLLLRAIEGYPYPLVRAAMKLSAYTFCRPGEIRHAEWSEIDLQKAEWRIPEEKMKMSRPHIVPLATQVVELFQSLIPLSGEGKYVFPSARTPNGSRPMSNMAVLSALRAMGFDKTQMTAHGFRSMASTLLNENGQNRDWIERQLAHVEGNSVRAAYNYAEYLKERKTMMQWYADYLDGLRDGKPNG